MTMRQVSTRTATDDLARVMSKWRGETEKNLGEVFDAA